MTDRITADILVEAFDLARPDFDDLKDRIEEAAAAHKATLTVDGRLYLADSAPAAPPSAPADADLRDRIAETVRAFDFGNYGLDAVDVALHDYPEQQEWVPALADAVLAVLSAPADHAAVLGEAITALEALAADGEHDPSTYVEELRRMADETQQAEAHASQNAWRVELYDPAAEEWVPGSSLADLATARARLANALERSPKWKDNDTHVQRRIVRETTTYTIEARQADTAEEA
ncbi:hypothetical protein [Streptomyces sp. NPDC058268]|uniref:hypothetical protein n=1 Tax=Streptomyces sp. NPDC058268 TaxID=3346413 RepID=UPI0036EE8894